MTELYIPIIAFSDNAIDSAIHVMHALVGYTVDLTIPDNTGYPTEQVYINLIDRDGDVVVCETNETGAPIRVPNGGGTWAVPINLIEKVTVL